MTHFCKYILICICTLLVFGCSANTTTVNVSQINWNNRLGVERTADDVAAFSRINSWWELLHSQELNSLIAQALANNETIQTGKEEFLSQMDLDTQAKSVLFPQVDTSLGILHKSCLKDPAVLAGTCSVQQHGEKSTTGYSGSLTIGYQVDLFGGTRAKIKAAELGMLISLEKWKSSLITVATNVTNNWLAMQLLLHQERIMLKQLRIAQNSEHLVELAYKAGGVDAHTLLNAKNQTADVREQINDLQSKKEAVDMQLRALIGKPESKIEYGQYNFDTQLIITAGIPASMLKQSPSIRMALAAVRIADQNVASAEAARFPQLGLTASVGGSSESLSKLVKPENLFWQLGTNLTMPLFDAGRRKAEVDRQRHLLQQQVHQYRNALFQTFSQVKINLNDLVIANKNLRSLLAKEKNIQAQLALKKLGYRSGSVQANDLLMEQNALYSIEMQILAKKQTRLTKQVAFYSVLANHWAQNYAKEIVADWESPMIDEKGND